MSVRRKDLFLVLAVILIAWVAVMAGLARWQRSRAVKQVAVQPELPHFPGTEAVQEQTVPNLGWTKYWFTLNEDYPSKSVYYFYRKELEPQGWRRIPAAEPQWYRMESGEEARDMLRATWLAPNRLHQIDLEMVSVVELEREAASVVGETREPGIRIYVTLRRVLMPGLLRPPQPTQPPRGAIEVH